MRALVLGAALAAAQTPDPPDPSRLLKTYTIDLDKPPEQRWVEIATEYKTYITTMRATVKRLFNKQTMETMVAAIKQGYELMSAKDDYAAELQGIATATGLPYDDIIMLNSYYELTKAKGSGYDFPKMCTSIVAQNANGSMYLGHNFDYPPYFAPGMLNAQFVKGGKKVFLGSVVAGTIGFMAGVVPGNFAVAIDARGAHTPPLADSVKAAEQGAYGFVVLTRKAMEVSASYDAAIKFYRDTPMISPGYLIVGGANPGEGAVVTANSSAVNNDVWPLKEAGGWYLVETNYDHWGPAPKSDDRRDPAIKRMEAIGTKDISLRGMWNVLSSKPNYPHSTVTTHIVDIGTGEYDTYLRMKL